MAKEQKYVITAISKLTGEREEISGVMSKEEALQRLEREQQSRKHQKYAAHTRLRVEQRLPVQLNLIFEDYE